MQRAVTRLFQVKNGSMPYHKPLRPNCMHTIFHYFILGLHCIQPAALFLAVHLHLSEYLLMSACCEIEENIVEG